MLPLAEMAIAKQDFVDVAYFEPFYLKDFVAIKSKSPF
jgi:tRNA threonylcarbamoyladenosine biosynthesis protein TsaB